MKHQSIKTIMFHANDARKHDVAWSSIANGFILENEDGICDESQGCGNNGIYDDLCEALADLMVAGGCEGFDFTITANPYGDA